MNGLTSRPKKCAFQQPKPKQLFPNSLTDPQVANSPSLNKNHDRKIFLQLWHTGRQVHPSLNSQGDVVSASTMRLEHGTTRNIKNESVHFEMYRACVERAKHVGFDGVEIHVANDYLVGQFLQSVTNLRTDQYSGSFENRARLLLEIVEALKSVWLVDHISVRLASNGNFAGMGSADNFEMFSYAIRQLSSHRLAYSAVLDGEFVTGSTDKSHKVTAYVAKQCFKGVVMANNSYTRDTAEGVVRSGATDLVGFGRLFISNSDLAERFENDWPPNVPVDVKYYWDGMHGVEGYATPPAYHA